VSRTRRKRVARSDSTERRDARPGSRGTWRITVPVIVVVAIVTAGWIVFRVSRTPGPASTGTPGTTDAAAPWGDAALAVGPVEAYARGVALVDSGLSVASLPYLARAVSAPGAPWQAWRAYASALHNVAMSAVTEPFAEGEAAPRSSFERIRMERMALERLDRAEMLTQANEDRAIVRLTRGQFLRTWGFPWDALQDFHRAGEIAEHWRDMGPYYAKLMRDPQRPETR
jgi:hypothetical protein